MKPACPKCRASLASDFNGAAEEFNCASCRSPIRISLYPALLRNLPEEVAGDAVALPDESSCFYHVGRKAVVLCGRCGRFLCSLCDIELGDQRLCPECISSGRKKGALTQLDRQRLRFDRIVLALAVYPMLLFYFTVLTAPAVIMLTFWFWNAPRSIVEPRPWRFILAAAIALLQIIGWVGLISWAIRTQGVA